MNEDTAIAMVGHAIQLSLAPVFLLSAIAAMLAVMTNRLARIVDRAREVEEKALVANSDELALLVPYLGTLSLRAKLMSGAIALCTITALFVCAVVASIFLGGFVAFDASLVVVCLFVGAMVTFFAGLVFFLREIFLATATLRIGPRA